MPSVIVNADDFGQTSGINRAVLELHKAGVLTSASMMANACASAEAIEMARDTPTLGTGCHVVLTDGIPICRYDQVPSLMHQPSGNFIPSLTMFLGRSIMGKIDPKEIEAETTAQIQYLQCSGVRVDHIDTHKHVHMFPGILRPILRAARSCGIHSVRKPFEPSWAVRATTGASISRRTQVNLLRGLESAWDLVLMEEGFATTHGSLGITATGVLDTVNVHNILSVAPPGVWELVTHPGYNDADLARIQTVLHASREVERQALYGLREFKGLDLISFDGMKSKPSNAG